MLKSCVQCSAEFEITESDLAFYVRVSPTFHGKRYDIPPPDKCSACRRQQRLSFRNFFNLYHRECNLTGKKIISMYDENVTFPVYEMHEWWSDKWDATDYGIDIDPARSFFEQVAQLHQSVPRMALMNINCDNSDYCNMSNGSSNCYLVFGNVKNTDCAYGHIVWHSQDCFDCLYIYRCSFCYECIDCVSCYSLSFSRDCDNCSSSSFLVHCASCKSCFGCVGLKNKEYHIFNEPHSKEEYEKKISTLSMGDARTVALAKTKVRELIGKEIVKYYHGFNCERVTGDYLYECKDIIEGYDMKRCENCSYCATLESCTDTSDCNFCGVKLELGYQCVTSGGYGVLCSHTCQDDCVNIAYCDNCYACKDCFGCISLKHKQYCIFNKQYSKEEYERLVPGVIERMRAAGEWGNFFPYSLSPFAYNETIASVYFPLGREEVLERKWRWKDMDAKDQHYLGPRYEMPNDIHDVADDVVHQILTCESTDKLYKIIPQELKFYRQMHLPIPRKCPDQRHKDRMAMRNPRHLWERQCSKCEKSIQTTYAPERPETVYCEDCYLTSVY